MVFRVLHGIASVPSCRRGQKDCYCSTLSESNHVYFWINCTSSLQSVHLTARADNQIALLVFNFFKFEYSMYYHTILQYLRHHRLEC